MVCNAVSQYVILFCWSWFSSDWLHVRCVCSLGSGAAVGAKAVDEIGSDLHSSDSKINIITQLGNSHRALNKVPYAGDPF